MEFSNTNDISNKLGPMANTYTQKCNQNMMSSNAAHDFAIISKLTYTLILFGVSGFGAIRVSKPFLLLLLLILILLNIMMCVCLREKYFKRTGIIDNHLNFSYSNTDLFSPSGMKFQGLN